MTASDTAYPFMDGEGELSTLIRNYDWATNPVGPPDQWPQSLRITLNIILNSRLPMFLWWGPELIQFYNDAYRPSLGVNGKHPTALGQRAVDCWPEIWSTIKPLIDQVLADQKPTWSENQLIPIYRNGQLETVYWTFGYSPVKDEVGWPVGVLVTCIETTSAVRSQQAMLRTQDQFHNLIVSAPVAIALFQGPRFIIELANEQVLVYWGRTSSEVLNKPLFEALPEASGQGFEELLTTVYTTGKRFVAKESTVTIERNGQLEQTYIDFVYEPYRESDGTITGIVVVCVEVTEKVLARQKIEESEERYRRLSEDLDQQVQEQLRELKQANEDLRNANQALKMANFDLSRSNDNLEQFAYIASHDLQEPLRKILQFGDLLRNGYDGATTAELTYVERIQAAARRMSVLIRDLLAFSRISTSKATSASMSLRLAVDQALEDLSVAVAESGAQIEVGALPTVQGDSTQLTQLFQNLLSNAIKFHRPHTSPVVRIDATAVPAHRLPPSTKPTQPSDVYHRIDVRDNGIGFDEKYTDRIFQVFQRLHGKNEFAGTGIGLAICEKVVLNHGGAIDVASQPNQGTTFSIYLPA